MRNKFLKILSIVVVCFVLVFSFAGCKSRSKNEQNSTNNTKQEEIQKPDINQDRPSPGDFDPMQGQGEK